MDSYKILQVDQTSTIDEIKYQYKKLAMNHHPDRGGDSSIFLIIKNAYDDICKQRKIKNDRTIIDSDIFKSPDFNFKPVHKDILISVDVTLLQSFTGTDLLLNYELSDNEYQTVIVNIPPGVSNNQLIKFDFGKTKLKAIVNIIDDPKFTRFEDDLYTVLTISAVDAMIGCKKQINTIDSNQYDIKIPAGTQHGTEIAIKHKGFKKQNKNSYGNLIVVIKVNIPTIIDPHVLKILTDIQDKYIF